jgi:arylformamidase
MERAWVDVSISIHSRMVRWPGDPEIVIERLFDVGRGDPHTLSRVSMGAHTGTHVDAPAHFLEKGPGIDQMPLDVMVSTARILAIRHSEEITADELEGHGIRPGETILFKTANSTRCWKHNSFVADFVSLSAGAARLLVSSRARLVGIDYLSVGGFKKHGAEVHRILLEAGIWIVEGLDLSEVEPGTYEFLCLPLKILGCDGAPARVLVRPCDGPA